MSVKDFAQHIIFLFERAPGNDATLEPEHARKWQALWDQCVAPGNNLMADRMKILPYLSHGANFLMAKVVNNQPGQLAEALEKHAPREHEHVAEHWLLAGEKARAAGKNPQCAPPPDEWINPEALP